MATIKHIASKNSDYGAAEKYLTFEHDEFTAKPLRDEHRRLIPRQDYRIGTLNCGGENFAIACMRVNLKYGKNLKKGDVKSHHYIISFDPRDGSDNGLTVDKAQELGEKFCAEHFPGHQALVCTHPDGHNHSGNIHVHIVINSLRIAEVERKPYMDRKCDTQAGAKHRCTAAFLRYLCSEVMEMCQREGLYQIDLLGGSQNRVSEREYWAGRKGQVKQDKENVSQKQPTKFETDKEKLRVQIRAVLASAATFDEFVSLLSQQGITVKESRGRLSYLTPDRTKPITARRLGDVFDLEGVKAVLERKTAYPLKDHSGKTNHSVSDTKSISPLNSVQRMVDVTAKLMDGKGTGYLKWANRFNLQQMAGTMSIMSDFGYDLAKLDAAIAGAHQETRDALADIKSIESAIAEKKELLTQLLAYWCEKDVRNGLKEQKSDKARAAYRREHESSFIISETAQKYFREHGLTKLPSVKALRSEIELLTTEKNKKYNIYRERKQKEKHLLTVQKNVAQILNITPTTPDRKKEHER